MTIRRQSCATLCAASLLLAACGTTTVDRPPSDHFDGKHFFNPTGPEPAGLGALLRWQFNGDRQDWPEHVAIERTAVLPASLAEGTFAVTYVNHATLLVQLPGLNILTDPVWSERVSPFTWTGPKRVHAPGIPFEGLPRIDVVLVSHNHYDHLDVPTLQRLAATHHPRILVPLGDKAWLTEAGVTGVEEADWWDEFSVGEDTKVVFTPSQHWSARGLFDRRRSLWGSYVVERRGEALYFAGDTGYAAHFRATAARFPRIRVALLPIGAYEPRWFMQPQHMNPADAVQALLDLKAEVAVGMHFGCWQLTDEAIDQPAKDLEAARSAAGIPAERFAVPKPGETKLYHAVPTPSP